MNYGIECTPQNPHPMDEGLTCHIRLMANSKRQAIRRFKRLFPGVLLMAIKRVPRSERRMVA